MTLIFLRIKKSISFDIIQKIIIILASYLTMNVPVTQIYKIHSLATICTMHKIMSIQLMFVETLTSIAVVAQWRTMVAQRARLWVTV